ncbi:hypothetical protein EZV73_23625 [Acidaminobacter sp. JC074]|uniref:hypothetical protein n=1 Tax=Acidaminobacter sp. JC074 TaxID=2530199 RepID=UPI001F10854D|nr:hypothetical protein [Acidaminobacter sp. JC074]MCH4890592.1 hypothetical protein [Acidaminobacter sp. JC074]
MKLKLIFIVVVLLLWSCTTEKNIKIDSIDDVLEEISDQYDEVYNIKMTYIAYTFFFNVKVYQNEETFDKDLVLNDLQVFLSEKTNQDIIRAFHDEKFMKDIYNPMTPTLKIALISYNDKFPTEYYALYIEESDDGYGHKSYSYSDEWQGPLYDKHGD